MNLDAITMDRATARREFLAYRRAVRERHSREDEIIMKGYGALSRGKQVINLRDVIAAGGVDEQHRPKLAIARSDLTNVGMHRWTDGRVAFDKVGAATWRSRSATRVALPAGTMPVLSQSVNEWQEFTSVVPIVPASLRPAGALSNYWTLFEADWRRVPVDPALLRSLGGGLYIVLATWDLTPLESAVLGITRR